MTTGPLEAELRIAELIDAAEDSVVSSVERSRLLIDQCNPDRSVADLRNILRASGLLFDRGVPVRIVINQVERRAVAEPITPDGLVLLGHAACRPFRFKDGLEVDARLPRSMATMYLDWRGEWRLAVLNGISSAPLLQDDGTIFSGNGYDASSGMWLDNVPDCASIVSARPSTNDAIAALRLFRDAFKTFCFADAQTTNTAGHACPVVDINKPPGKDESGFLNAALTAVCRPSLQLAPGVLFRAAPMSGSGAGKGLLARCICLVAFGRQPHAVTAGATAEEFEKRMAAELIAGGPVLFLDNLNDSAVKSDLLASVITERPTRIRILGKSKMVPLNASAFIILTGNGVKVSEDLARRFVTVDFDPRTEDPEARSFSSEIHADICARRMELLAALLTIWRWGRLEPGIQAGRTLGSFEKWGRWIRDPLLTLGCQDPVDRISDTKHQDSRRRSIAELYAAWWERHGSTPVPASGLHREVTQVVDPQGRGRQFLASYLERNVGARMGGFVLTRQASTGKWGTATYALITTDGSKEDRGHRGLGTVGGPIE